MVYAVGLGVDVCLGDGVFLHSLSQSQSVYTLGVAIEQPALVKLTENAKYAACASALLYAIFLSVRSKLAQAWHLAAQLVNVLHAEVGSGLLSHSQQVQHGIGASSHGYVERHGIEESLPRGDALWQHALVAILIVCVGVLDNLPCGGLEEFYAVLVGSKNCTVARQRQADGLCERVHGVGGEHPRAAAASRA